jgi:outer membrane protein assembly factor BamB
VNHRLRLIATLALVGVVLGSTLSLAVLAKTGAGATASPGGVSSWTVYHGDALGNADSTALGSVDTTSRAWTSPHLSGQLYGEPLVFSSNVYVATESDTVYALSASTGRVVWSRHVAGAVPSSLLPCGNITPTVGITGTPVIDPSRHEIFVVADELVGGRPQHRLVGLDTVNGAVELNRDVDPPGADPAALLQRTGLTLDRGRVVFAMGGNYGDCATYRGRVASVSATGASREYFSMDAAAGDRQGAIWMGGAAPVVDARGDVWVSVGNGSVHSAGQAFDDSDSVLDLSSALHLIQYFAPTTWPQNNAQDLDMSTAPVLLGDGQVILAGKSRIVYLLNGRHLGGVGQPQASLPSACSHDIDGGSAVAGLTVFLPCLSGTVAVRVTSSPPKLALLWSAQVGGGPPIYAAGLVWTIGSNGTLYALSPSTGTLERQANVGVSSNDFPTPSVGDGLLIAPSTNHVVAFHGAAKG